VDEPSLGQQAQEMRREATRRGWQIMATLEDVLTGSVPVRERPGGREIYARAEQDKFEAHL
jgi:hypothetical protein